MNTFLPVREWYKVVRKDWKKWDLQKDAKISASLSKLPLKKSTFPKATSQLWQVKQRMGTKSEAQIFSLLTALLTWEQGHAGLTSWCQCCPEQWPPKEGVSAPVCSCVHSTAAWNKLQSGKWLHCVFLAWKLLKPIASFQSLGNPQTMKWKTTSNEKKTRQSIDQAVKWVRHLCGSRS